MFETMILITLLTITTFYLGFKTGMSHSKHLTASMMVNIAFKHALDEMYIDEDSNVFDLDYDEITKKANEKLHELYDITE